MGHTKVPEIPVPAWIALLCATIALGPARNLWRHLGDNSSTTDNSPTGDQRRKYGASEVLRDLTIVLIAIFFAFFAFTSEAASIAHEDWFFPALIGCFGLFACWTAWRGWQRGRIQPLIRGFSETYDRTEQPKRFWASLAWNSLFGIGMAWMAVVIERDNLTPRCNAPEASTREAMMRSVEECRKILARNNASRQDFAALYFAAADAAWQQHDGDLTIALATKALKFDPNDRYALNLRAQAYYDRGDEALSQADDDRFVALSNKQSASGGR